MLIGWNKMESGNTTRMLSIRAKTWREQELTWGKSIGRYPFTFANFAKSDSFDYIVQMWYDEISRYDYKNPTWENAAGETVGHFAQVIWKSTKKFGIGAAKWPGKPGSYYVVARYIHLLQTVSFHFSRYYPRTWGDLQSNVLPLIPRPWPTWTLPALPKTNNKQLFVGHYECTPFVYDKNDWHTVDIYLEKEQLMWKNKAGIKWKMDLRNSVLWKTNDLYFEAQVNRIRLNNKSIFNQQKLPYRLETGQVVAVSFRGEDFFRVGASLSTNASIATTPPTTSANTKIAKKSFIGNYERTPVENDWHRVELYMEGKQLMWRNKAGAKWKMNVHKSKLNKSDKLYYPKQVQIVS